MSWYTNTKLWSFVGGVAAAAVAGIAAKSPLVRKATINGVSKVMIVKENCEASIQSIKDDAEDLTAEARGKAAAEAAVAARRAEIEERVRAQVEAELAAEGEKADE